MADTSVRVRTNFYYNTVLSHSRNACLEGTRGSIEGHRNTFDVRGCLHDTSATFIPVRVHFDSVFVYMIPTQNLLPDRAIPVSVHPGHCTQCTGKKIFIPVRKLIPISCKGRKTVRSGIKITLLSGESGTSSACVVLDIQFPLYY